MKIEKAKKTGFCYGVNRAIDMACQAAHDRGEVETLGSLVHNPQVVEQLAREGIRSVKDLDSVRAGTVAITAHGVSPEREAEIRSRSAEVIDTTCPFVHRAQLAARRLAKAGFFVIVYGEADHPEVKGILGWAQGKGLATMEIEEVARLAPLPRRLGVVSQTTQIPAYFTEFAGGLLDAVFTQNSELHIIDTICHDIRKRQNEALRLAGKADLMLVVGGRNSANANHLARLVSTLTEAHLVETAKELQPSWLRGKNHVGVISGASTAEQTVDEVVAELKALGKQEAKTKKQR